MEEFIFPDELLGCNATNTSCQACVDNTSNDKTFSTLSPDAKAIFLANYEKPVSSRSVLSSTTLRTSNCSHPSRSTACTATPPKKNWSTYLTYISFIVTILASILGVVFALRSKSNAKAKFLKLKSGTHPTTGKALDPSKEKEMHQTRNDFYKMTGAK